jgi:type IV secretion system protein VirB4
MANSSPIRASARELLVAGELAGAEAVADAHIPYIRHHDAETLVTLGGALVQVVTFDGLPVETASMTDLAHEKEARSRALLQVRDAGGLGATVSTWTTLLRAFDSGYPGGSMPPGFAADLDRYWRERWLSKRSLSNRWFVSFVHSAPMRVGGLSRWLDAILGGQKADDALAVWRDNAARRLTDVVSLYTSALRAYGPRLLTIRDVPGVSPVSEPLSFAAELINGQRMAIAPPARDARRVLHVNRIGFGDDIGETVDVAGNRRYFAMLGVQDYPSATASWMLDGLASLPFELVATQSFVPMASGTAQAKVEQARRDFHGAGDGAEALADDLVDALEAVQRGNVAFGAHHYTVQVRGDSPEEVREAVSAASSVLNAAHIQTRRERRNLEPAFWAQLPGNGAYIARSAPVTSRNVASFSSLHGTPAGRLNGHKWGPATTVLESRDGSPRYFSLHAHDVGNTLIQGPTGSGKTVLGLFLAFQALRAEPKPRLIALDRDRGMDIAIRALGGRYTTLKRGVRTGWNPFAFGDDDDAKAFVVNFVELLIGGDDGVSATERMALRKAVDGVYRLDRQHWRLSSVGAHLPFAGPESLGARLSPWIEGGEHAWLFDGAFGSSVDWFGAAGAAGIDLSVALDDRRLAAPVSTFVFRQIRQSVSEGRLILLVDEGWRYVRDPATLAELEGQGRTNRKMDGLMVFMSQSDEADSPAAQALIKTLATKILFPFTEWNKARLREVFGFSEREIELSTEDLVREDGRWFLVRQHGIGSVCRAMFDRHGERFLWVLSGTKNRVALCERLRNELGNDPAAWLPAYLSAVEREKL